MAVDSKLKEEKKELIKLADLSDLKTKPAAIRHALLQE